jgi:hypothetical protein
MEAINTQIAKFDENLKAMITNKINKELEASISDIIKKTYDNVIELQCNEYLSNNSSFDLISEGDYNKLRTLGVTKDRESIMWYTYFGYMYQGAFRSCSYDYNTFQDNYFIVYNNGLIELKCGHTQQKFKSWHLNHEPTCAFIDILKLEWSFYNKGIFCGTRLEKNPTEYNHTNIDRLIEGMIEPVIEIFKNQKPYQLNADILKVLNVEQHLKEKENSIDVRETMLLKNEDEFEDKQNKYIDEADNKIKEMEDKYNNIVISKKELMKRFIEQEKKIRYLNLANAELDEKYELLLNEN